MIPVTAPLQDLAEQSADLIKGWRLSATLQLRTPLRILRRHGEISPNHGGPPPVEEMQHYAWTAVLKTHAELGIPIPELEIESWHASDVGPVPVDGGEYLHFLLAVREIVEAPSSVSERLARLRGEMANPDWAGFVVKLGGREAIYSRFFPPFIETLSGLPADAIKALWSADLTTPRALAAASDARLRSIKGIGPAKLKGIRAACEAAPDKDAERLDMVER